MAKTIAGGVIICIGLMVLAANVPVIGSLGALLLPLAVLFFRLKLGPEKGLAVPVAAGALFAVSGAQATTDALVMATLMVLGYVLGHLLARKWPIAATVAGACGMSLCVATGVLVMAGAAQGRGVAAMIDAQVGEHLAMVLTLYRGIGMDADRLRVITDNIEQIRYVLVRLLPGLAVMATLVSSWLTLLMARPLLSRTGMAAPAIGPLRCWKAPEPLVWVAIACGVMLLLPARDLKILGLNGIVVLMTVYFFQGMAIVAFFFEKRRLPNPLRGALYGLIALQQFLVLFIVAAGFFDIWLNFRKLDNQQPHC